jgi:two-component system, OmpR family, sensor histidine kinase TctE
MTSPRGSLRARMLWRVLLPLAATWFVGSAIALYLAWTFAGRAFDQALLDNAYAIAANVGTRDGELVLNLSPREVENVLFDRAEKEYFVVFGADGRVLAGNPELEPPPARRGAALPEFSAGSYLGVALRLATLRSEGPPPFVVVVGQTTQSRTQLLRSLLVRSLAPQALLLLLLGTYLRHQIHRELQALVLLQRELDRRDSSDLGPVALPALSHDVARLRDAVNGLLARIERGVQAQREFAGNVAHDLRTPLAGIRALAEYGLARGDPDISRQQLKSIVASEERASRLVEQLLALALADEARDSIKLEVVLVDELVRRVLLGFVPRADAAGVDLGATGLDTPTPAYASTALLEGVLANLIDNALRYGRSGASATLTVEVSSEDGTVSVAVIDDGPGLDQRQREQPPRRWERGPTGVELGDGAGLGLAIASRYAALLGGSLRLEPGPGRRGLRAVVTLRAATENRIKEQEHA